MSFDTTQMEIELETLNQQPFAVWYKDKNLKYRLANNNFAKIIGFLSSDISFEGITDYNIECKAVELASEFEGQDNLAMSCNKISTICAGEFYQDNFAIFLSHKYSKLDKNGNIIGMSGICTDITSDIKIQSILLQLAENKLLRSLSTNKHKQLTYTIQDNYTQLKLTQRESECLFLLIRGMTAKEIAYFLDRSYKTIEKHLVSAKFKMDCSSRSELVDKAINLGVGSIIPTSIFKK